MAKHNSNAHLQVNATPTSLRHVTDAASLQQPFGTFVVDAGSAHDHAEMRAAQLSSLLRLMHMEGGVAFDRLGTNSKQDILWLACQLADEVHLMVPVVAKEILALGGGPK